MMNEFLFTTNKINIKNDGWIEQINNDVTEKPAKFFNQDDMSNNEMWNKFVGNIPYETTFNGIKDKFTIIQPEKQMGDLCGLYWTMMAGFELFRNADRIIILEDDLIFNKNWFNISNYIYEKEKMSKLGIISVYNREPNNTNQALYKSIDNIGGVMYMISRSVYDVLKRNKKIILDIDPEKNIAGDVHFQNQILNYQFNILNTNESYIQHIGIKSSIRPGRFLRISRNFIQPYTWSNKI